MTPEALDELKKAAERICDGYTDDLDAGAVLALLTEREKLLKVVEAARNIVAVKGRHHTEQAFVRLSDALKELDK